MDHMIDTTSDATLGKATARFFRILGDPTRLKILELLAAEPQSVTELIKQIGSSQARISTHLACLRWCGFVETERHGRQIIYSLKDSELDLLIALAKGMTISRREHLASCNRIGPDWS